MDPTNLMERLLLEMIKDQVSEKLGDILRQVGDKLKKSGAWSEEDKKSAKLAILEMIRNSSGDFYQKMKERLEKGENKE